MAQPTAIQKLRRVHKQLQACSKCPRVFGPAVHGPALDTAIMLVGQAPGVHEGTLGRPFAYTAGKTLFKWLGEATGSDEEALREQIYFSAVARCFPGKHKSGSGDREPDREEIESCRPHLKAEIEALQPKLILAVGKVAIAEVLAALGISKATPLNDVVGKKLRVIFHGHEVDVIPLPHPSGISKWPRVEPGKTKLREALGLVTAEFQHLL